MGLRSFTFGDISREHRRHLPNHTAIVDGDIRLTWPEFDDRVNRAANALSAIGVGQGDRILWLAQTSFRAYELLLAAAKLGAMLCPVNWRQSPSEMAFVIDDMDASVVVWQDEEIGASVAEARSLAASSGMWIQHDAGGPGSYEDLIAASPTTDRGVDIDPDLPLLVIYTAGFGGKPAGSMMSHRNLLAMALNTSSIVDSTPNSVFLNCGPLFHLGTHQFEGLPVLLRGGTNIFTLRVVAEELLRIIHDERCTGAYLMPPTILQMVDANSDGRFDLSRLKGGPFGPMWHGMVGDDTSAWTLTPGGYGQTEVTGFAVFNGFGGPGEGNAGRPSPLCQVRIVDPDGEEVPTGEAGEIVMRGDAVHIGYWNRPELNEERFRSGWWHTTDLGKRHADGTISFIGTLARLIRSAAENIYPAEVEACIESHPAVKEAAIIGVPDTKFVQSVKAVVVIEEGQVLTETDVIDHCRERIASYKKPKSVAFVDVLPRKDGAKDYATIDAGHGGGNYPGTKVY